MTLSVVPNRATRLALYIGLTFMFLGCLLLQVFFLPLLATEAAREFPDVAYLQYPILIAAILTVACIETVLLATGILVLRSLLTSAVCLTDKLAGVI